ncbi:amino acid adenylation domain-containing protein [filamentous cyanobacterium LEGE 11480]|uniref:Amino acid adenylation domain-containing protein n=1 Tax=Romeriopsis navalis LEGE 11480 TaxID=2777977 RepID=A0A928VI62_9CYAN|nr:amino acid adenylation domain-containing protein [Romeriopsis navalis]MBE9029046.1 amino acid adenylation domain-containing protein [Romeriopsis navalis LEGE 11480]
MTHDMGLEITKLSPVKRALLEQYLQQKAAPIQAVVSIADSDREAPLVLSFAQQRMWFVEQLEQGKPIYNRPTPLRLTGSLNLAALTQSLNEIVRRHDVLRSCFPTVDGQPRLKIAPTLEIEIPVVDLSQLAKSDQSDSVQNWIYKDLRQPFTLFVAPLFRTRLLKLGETEHLLLTTLHHLIFDGWSAGVFKQELAMLYGAFANGVAPPLAPLPMQYVDFAHWQQQQQTTTLLQPHLAYWKSQFQGELPVLDLPTDRPCSAQSSAEAAIHTHVLSNSLLDELKILSQREGVTLFMTLLAAFKVLLYRYTGQTDVIVGTPVAGRDRLEFEPLIGVFINTLALRTSLAGNPTFQNLLSQVRQVALDGYAHQTLPFEQLVEAIQPERQLGQSPITQIVFQLRNLPDAAHPSPGLIIEDVQPDKSFTAFDLTLEIDESPQGLACRFLYRIDRFDALTLQRMAGHFQTLLQGIMANPSSPIAALPILTESEQQQLFVEWNSTQTDYSQERCIHQCFEAQTKITPNNIAAICQTQELTYEQLNGKANSVAAMLVDQGIGRGHYVPVLIDRGLNLLIAYLAVLKTGAAFVPMDPKWPFDRVAKILVELDSDITLVESACPHRVELSNSTCLEVNVANLAEQPGNLDIPVSAVDPMYVIFTSGSTGTPKGAVNQHQGILNRFANMNERYGCHQDDVILCTSAHIFDSSVWQLLWPLTNGAPTVITPPGFGFDLIQIINLIEHYRVTISDFVPSVFNILVDHISNHTSDQAKLCSLRQLLIGGEAMNSKDIYRFKSLLPQIGITNTYGPTETAIGVVFYEVPPEFTEPIPIGRPLNNVYCLILDPYLNPVPVGVTGELYLGGVCVGLGYLNDPAKTDAVFLDNPFPSINSQKLYKTGDLVRYQPDGNIEFLGRDDDQVKIRGVRIELDEIASYLAQHPSVNRTLVTVQGEANDRHLVSYVMAKPGYTVVLSELQNFLKQKLPAYMVPSALVLVDDFPLTTNGKIDHRALPKPNLTQLRQIRQFVLPSTPTEKQLSQIWCDLLGLEQVGIYDSFFELGGHSLLATQLVSQIRDVLSVELPLSALFTTPTIAELTDIINLNRASMTSSKADDAGYENITALLDELENLSDQEVKQHLMPET